jgi:hypothetical protein
MIDNLLYIETDLWDTVEIYPSKKRYNLFQETIGSWYKTEVDTNMVCQGMLPAPQTFEIEGIMVLANRDSYPESVNKIFSNYSMNLWLGQRIYGQWMLDRFPINGDYKQLWCYKKNRWVLPRPIRFNEYKPKIMPQQYFRVELVGDDKPIRHEPTKVKVILSGVLGLGVQ